MPLPANFSRVMRALLWGTPWGETYPTRAQPTPLPLDGRTAALDILRRYLSELTFYRVGARNADGTRGAPEQFRIPRDSIHIEWPDHEEDLTFPSIALLSTGPANFETIGLTSYLDESSKDVYAPGTVLQYQYEHVENVAIEVWANKRAERRAILAGLEVALTPTEQMYGVRFRMPDYYGQIVCFSPQSRELFEEPEAARGRRRARVLVETRFVVAALVNYNALSASLGTQVDVDEATGLAVQIDANVPSGTLELFGGEPARAANLPPLVPCGPESPFGKGDP